MKSLKFLILLIGVLLFLTSSVSAQFNVKAYVKDKAKEKADQSIKKGVDDVFDSKKKEERVENEEEEKTYQNEPNIEQEEKEVENNISVTKPDDKPKLESYTQYDFVPGDKILFFEDFSQDAIGDFPALWLSNGSGEVKKISIAQGNWFHLNGESSVYCFQNNIVFPDNYIIEFDIIPDDEYYRGIIFTLFQTDPENAKEVEDGIYPGLYGLHIIPSSEGWETIGYGYEKDWLGGSATKNPILKEQVNHVIIWVQKRRVRIYHMGAKVIDVPTNIYAEGKFNRLRFSGWDRASYPYISNLKITTASPDTRSKLLTEGKIISYGIYFDSGKDVVKSESYGSVKDIANVLTENPNVKIMIVGHTDSDGDDATNLDLSKRRAANVKTYLVKEFGIAADRISTDGKGETQPIAPNNSSENKAKNRRVEFIKL